MTDKRKLRAESKVSGSGIWAGARREDQEEAVSDVEGKPREKSILEASQRKVSEKREGQTLSNISEAT